MLDILAAGTPHYLHWADLGLTPGISLGFFTLRWYSLAYLAGIVLGYWHLSRMVRAPGSPMAQRHADDLFFYCTIGIILGGRLGYLTFYDPSLWTSFEPGAFVSWRAVRLWDGGMSFHGGLIGTLLAIAWVAWSNKLSFIRLADYIAVNVGFGMMFGRIANFINGELWGRPTDVPWAMIFPTDPLGLPRHPSQLYEAVLEGALIIAVMLPLFWYTRARWRPGLLTGVFTVMIAAARFTVEFFREPDAQLEQFAMRTGLSMGQWLTIPLILGALGLVAWSLSRKPVTGAAFVPQVPATTPSARSG